MHLTDGTPMASGSPSLLPATPRLVSPPAMSRGDEARGESRTARVRKTVEKTLPEILRDNSRARRAAGQSVVLAGSQLHDDATPVPAAGGAAQLRVRVKQTDTLTAARHLTYSGRRARRAAAEEKKSIPDAMSRVCILNQASARKAGGGFIDGTQCQEGYICHRSTLFASLRHDMYPLPDVGGIFSPDVLVFADSDEDASPLSASESVHIDAISAAMEPFQGSPRWRSANSDDVDDGCTCGISYCNEHRDAILAKMAAVVRMAELRGVKQLVLGAWGCGILANPSLEIAKFWRRTLFGTPRRPRACRVLEEVVFAVTDRACLRDFEKVFGDVADNSPLLDSSVDLGSRQQSQGDVEREQQQFDSILEDIAAAEEELTYSRTGHDRSRLRARVEELHKQLAEVGRDKIIDSDEAAAQDDVSDGFVIAGYAYSDPDEDGQYVHFDDNDIASLESASPESPFEFRFVRHDVKVVDRADDASSEGGSYVHAAADISEPSSPTFTRASTKARERCEWDMISAVEERKRMDEADGWFTGSVDELSALLRTTSGFQGALQAPSRAKTPDELRLPQY